MPCWVMRLGPEGKGGMEKDGCQEETVPSIYTYPGLLLPLLSRFGRVRLCATHRVDGRVDGSPPGSPIPGILQARTLEWVAISFSSA